MPPDFKILMGYKNENIVSRYQIDYPDSTMSGNEALTELKKYIWLSLKHKEEREIYPQKESLHFNCAMHEEMRDIDNMWHTFLLFTKDYQDFCQEYLNGVFFHHFPLINAANVISEESYELELTRYLSYIYDNLGEDELVKWFSITLFNKTNLINECFHKI